MTTELSVVTPTQNRAPILGRCLDALGRQTLDPSRYEVLVVDDASTDGTRAVVEEATRQARYPLRSYWLPERLGVSAARNLAIREARSDVIVFVDSDCIAVPMFLSAHLETHKERSGIVCRGPVIATHSLDRPFTSRGGVLDISTAFFDTDNASARREDLFRVGLLDEAFFPYGWDGLDLGLRLRDLGLRRIYRRDAALYHYQPEVSVSPGTLEAMLAKEDHRARNAWRFFAKHPTLESRFAMQLTPFHLALNAAQRGFGVVHAGNVEAWVARARRWRMPGLGRILLSGVLNERYLSLLHAHLDRSERAHGD
jgi:glycosyltransferase involved in cell wall biosynthesis